MAEAGSSLMSDVRTAVGVVDHTVRCDACGALAYFSTYVHMTELSWCAHHWREFEPKLRADATLTLIVERTEESDGA